jgi:hypothetical protein
MGAQFPDSASIYGAPMGRHESRIPTAALPARSVRLYRVRINAGGYDDGGAYWGIGEPLYCAEACIGENDYRQFTRACSRSAAAQKLSIPPYALIRRA